MAGLIHGWIILDKPFGLGSTQAVSAVKHALREAGEPKTKVGHGGTLDPLASGVLPIAIGEATKLAGRMLDATKAYEFTIRFGEETDTLDAEGEVIARNDVRPTLAQIEAVLPRFTGEIEQVPPVYSALKIDGKAAYARARAGEEVKMEVPLHRKNSGISAFAGMTTWCCHAPSPRAPISAPLPAISPMRLELWDTFPILDARAPDRSGLIQPFRWTF
jgi:tRNA pseudouridine(55) synthase